MYIGYCYPGYGTNCITNSLGHNNIIINNTINTHKHFSMLYGYLYYMLYILHVLTLALKETYWLEKKKKNVF